MKLTMKEEEKIAEIVAMIEDIDFSKCKMIDRNVFALGEIKSKLEHLEAYSAEIVCRARRDGMSWCRIGEVLGISEVTAKSRFPQTD